MEAGNGCGLWEKVAVIIRRRDTKKLGMWRVMRRSKAHFFMNREIRGSLPHGGGQAFTPTDWFPHMGSLTRGTPRVWIGRAQTRVFDHILKR